MSTSPPNTPLPRHDITTLSPLPSKVVCIIYSYFLAQDPLESKIRFLDPLALSALLADMEQYSPPTRDLQRPPKKKQREVEKHIGWRPSLKVYSSAVLKSPPATPLARSGHTPGPELTTAIPSVSRTFVQATHFGPQIIKDCHPNFEEVLNDKQPHYYHIVEALLFKYETHAVGLTIDDVDQALDGLEEEFLCYPKNFSLPSSFVPLALTLDLRKHQLTKGLGLVSFLCVVKSSCLTKATLEVISFDGEKETWLDYQRMLWMTSVTPGMMPPARGTGVCKSITVLDLHDCAFVVCGLLVTFQPSWHPGIEHIYHQTHAPSSFKVPNQVRKVSRTATLPSLEDTLKCSRSWEHLPDASDGEVIDKIIDLEEEAEKPCCMLHTLQHREQLAPMYLARYK
ncbi:hypothetical protein IAR50_005777 [Cryptococcus sp. DSM 104548]